MIVLLELLLIVLLIANYYLQGKSCLAPSFLYTASFVFSLLWAIAFQKRWELTLSAECFWVLLVGAVSFSVAAWGVHRLFHRAKPEWNNRYLSPLPMRLSSVWGAALLAVSAFTFVMTVLDMMRITGVSDPVGAIGAYRNAVAFTPHAPKVEGYLYYLGILVRGAGFWFAYRIGTAIGDRRVPDVWSILCFSVCLVFSVLSGGRNDLVSLVITAAASALFRNAFLKGNAGVPLRPRLLLAVLLMAAVGLSLFAFLTPLIGRNVARTEYFEYLAVYCGAPIKNLDSALREGIARSEVFGQRTLIHFVQWLGTRFHAPIPEYSIVLPYRYVGERSIGNVYTTYYAFLADFGAAGVVLLPALMAAISQLVYELQQRRHRATNLWTIVYGFFASAIAFSYFSNKFFEAVATVNFVKYCAVWIALNLLVLRGNRDTVKEVQRAFQAHRKERSISE